MSDREDRRLYTRSDWKSDSAARYRRGIEGVTDRLPTDREGEKSSLRYDTCLAFDPLLIAFASRYVLQLLTPALILAQLGGRTQIELEDIGEMTNLFLDSKTNASNLAKGRGFDGGKMW